MRFALPAIWAIAAIGIGGALAGRFWWSSMQGVSGYIAMRDGQLSQFVYGLSLPLLILGLLATIVALTVHAALWRRDRLTPPAPSP